MLRQLNSITCQNTAGTAEGGQMAALRRGLRSAAPEINYKTAQGYKAITVKVARKADGGDK